MSATSLIPGDRRLADWARAAFAAAESKMLAAVRIAIGESDIQLCRNWAYTIRDSEGMTNLEWLKTPPRRHAPSTLAETLGKIRSLKDLRVHQWTLDIALAKQQAYAAHVQLRRPSMTLRIERVRQDLEIVCFLRVTLLELTDATLLQANRRSQQLFREAAQRVQARRSGHNASILQSAVKAKAILTDDTRDWRERVIEARAALADIEEATTGSFAAQVRRALAEDSRRVHACLAGLSDLDLAGAPQDRGFAQWQAWSMLQETLAIGATEAFGSAVPIPPVGAAWSPLVHDLDPKSGYRAFEACALMSLRRGLRRGSVWIDHSIAFRGRRAMLLSGDEWAVNRDQHLQILGLPSNPREFLEPVLAAVSVGLCALAEAVRRGRIEIGADRLLHVPPLSALSDESEPRKTREAVFQRIGDVQLPDILLEVDAATPLQ